MYKPFPEFETGNNTTRGFTIELFPSSEATVICIFKRVITNTWTGLSLEENLAAKDLISLTDERSQTCN